MKPDTINKLADNAEDLVIERWIEKLRAEKKLVIKGFGTFFLLPRRKGETYGFSKGLPAKYIHRVRFMVSDVLKRNICK